MKDKVINDLLKRISDLEFEVERLEKVINKIRDYVYKPIDKEWDDILCIIEDELKGVDKE